MHVSNPILYVKQDDTHRATNDRKMYHVSLKLSTGVKDNQKPKLFLTFANKESYRHIQIKIRNEIL